MEGVIDQHMRALLTQIGGYSACVTEFVRVIDRLLPDSVFYRFCPELHHDGKTPAGIPVVLQLLGGIPEVMAINAQRAAHLGVPGIDINFGCPSKFVNRKAGGAVLLKEPERVFGIVQAVRKAVPAHIPVSAKIRLGYEDTSQALDNAHAVADAGADFITVHARTKLDGYKAPARWHWLATINNALTIPVIANGDIKSLQDYRQCLEISGCSDIMIGRGALSRPDLAKSIKYPMAQALQWIQIPPLIAKMYHSLKAQPGIIPPKILGRLKQWLAYLKNEYHEAHQAFIEIRTFRDIAQLEQWLIQKTTLITANCTINEGSSVNDRIQVQHSEIR